VDHSISAVVSFLQDRVDEAATPASFPIRGPYLAQLELLRLMKERGDPTWNTILGMMSMLLVFQWYTNGYMGYSKRFTGFPMVIYGFFSDGYIGSNGWSYGLFRWLRLMCVVPMIIWVAIMVIWVIPMIIGLFQLWLCGLF